MTTTKTPKIKTPASRRRKKRGPSKTSLLLEKVDALTKSVEALTQEVAALKSGAWVYPWYPWYPYWTGTYERVTPPYEITWGDPPTTGGNTVTITQPSGTALPVFEQMLA